MESYLPDEALILVAVMPNPRDLEIARLLGWYRIPLRSSPKVIDVDYLAFYQAGGFEKGHNGRIEYIARLRGYELTTREELFRDEPLHPHAHEEYFKLQIGSLEPLPHPILADKWKRMTFLFTTGELLRKAQTFHDLVVRSEEREILWRSLRERAVQTGRYQADELPEIAIDPTLLQLLGLV